MFIRRPAGLGWAGSGGRRTFGVKFTAWQSERCVGQNRRLANLCFVPKATCSQNGQTSLGLTNLRFTQPTSSRKHKTGTYGALCKPKVCKPKVCPFLNSSQNGQTTGWRVDGSRRHSVGAGPRRYPGSTPGPGLNQCTRRGPRLTLSAQARGPGVGGHKKRTRKP